MFADTFKKIFYFVAYCFKNENKHESQQEETYTAQQDRILDTRPMQQQFKFNNNDTIVQNLKGLLFLILTWFIKKQFLLLTIA